jgi:putative hydrolase of HD superfamily
MSGERVLLDLLLELQTLDRVPRSGYALRGIAAPESVSEHTFHLIFLVWALAAEEPEIDRSRAVELALVHDLVEVRTGDLPRTAAHAFPAGAKAHAEAVIGADLLAPLGDRGVALLAEYQAKETPEACFVSACDKLQVRIKAAVYENWGARGLDDFWDDFATKAEQMPFASLRRLARSLLAKRKLA